MAPKKVSFDPESKPSPEEIEEENEEMEFDEEEVEQPDEMEEDDDGLEMEMGMGVDLGAVLATEDGDTLCTALLDINDTLGQMAQQLSVTNKILVKMMSKMK